MSIKTLHGIVIKGVCFLAILMPVCAQSTTANALQHPRDQIALQLGAIQMGYTVPFTLVSSNATNAQQAANALLMGRNALDATLAKPAVKVEGFLNSPSMDTVEFRDQLYQAVEAVVTSPAVGTIKGSATLVGGKKQNITAKLSAPPNSYTIPVPFALESATSVDTQDLAAQISALSSNVTAVQSQSIALSSNLTTLQTQSANMSTAMSSLGANLTTLQSQNTALSGNFATVQSQTTALSSNLTALKTQSDLLSGNSSALQKLLVSYGIIPLFEQQTNVSTLAGSGNFSFGNGTTADICAPGGVAVDASGNVYVTEPELHRIKKITASGNVTTFAGGFVNASDYFGDAHVNPNVFIPLGGYRNGQGTEARFLYPTGVAVDASGNVYVADTGNNLIRKITPSGNVTTLAGNATESNDLYEYSSRYGNPRRAIVWYMYENDEGSEWVDTYERDYQIIIGAVDGQGTEARFLYPTGLAVDGSGNVYVGDRGNGRIRKITPSGNVTTMTSNGMPVTFIDRGYQLAADNNGNIFYTQTTENSYKPQIMKLTSNGSITTMAGSYSVRNSDGPGTEASFENISGLAVDGSGSVMVIDCEGDMGKNRVRKIDANGSVTTLAGFAGIGYKDGQGTVARFSDSTGGVAVDANGDVYVSDTGNNRIRKITISK